MGKRNKICFFYLSILGDFLGGLLCVFFYFDSSAVLNLFEVYFALDPILSHSFNIYEPDTTVDCVEWFGGWGFCSDFFCNSSAFYTYQKFLLILIDTHLFSMLTTQIPLYSVFNIKAPHCWMFLNIFYHKWCEFVVFASVVTSISGNHVIPSLSISSFSLLNLLKTCSNSKKRPLHQGCQLSEELIAKQGPRNS